MTNIIQNLQELVLFTKELNSSNSSKAKLETLKKYSNNSFIKNVLYYTYNPYFQFFVTSKNLKKIGNTKGYVPDMYSDLFQLLDDLRSRKISGHNAIIAVNSFIKDLTEDVSEVLYNIIDKDLKCRISDTTINKVFIDLIPTFDVALGYPIEDCNPNFDTEEWFSSRKLDGIRVVTIIREHGDIKFHSRAGNEFTCFKKIYDVLLNSGLTNVVLDGEMCIMNGEIEDFKQMASEVKRLDFECENPGYRLFDFLTLEEFNSKQSSRKFIERLNELQFNTIVSNLPFIKILPQIKITDLAHYTALYNEAVEAGYEGLILRKNTVYEGKRTKNIIKCKPFYDAEYTVIRIETGPFRVIDKETKLEREEETLTNIYILHKGFEVSVGSGFSIEERRRFYKNPELIIGKVITVQYFEESFDSTGKPSLRMPTLKVIHGDKRTS